jgi:hypothetical protein
MPRPPPGRAPHAAASYAAWIPVDVGDGTSVEGGRVDQVEVRPGDVVRLDVGEPVAIGQRIRAGGSVSEVWRREMLRGGVIELRAGFQAVAILAARGAIRRAFVGHANDPGYYWFQLEERVLDWADGPLPAPFPAIAPWARIDRAGFGALDAALAREVAATTAKDAVRAGARAVRRIAGLRAVRALRPVTGFPYAFDVEVAPTGAGPTRQIGGRTMFEMGPHRPLVLEVNGPTTLHVWTRAARAATEVQAGVRVLEGDRERASAAATLPRQRLTTWDPSVPAEETPDLAPLARAIVHVPPGAHTYRVESDGRAWTLAIAARAVVHLEAQLLFWWVPRFNDIFYLRARATADAEERKLSHASVRPGVFLALGALDSGLYSTPRTTRRRACRLRRASTRAGSMSSTTDGWCRASSTSSRVCLGAIASTPAACRSSS